MKQAVILERRGFNSTNESRFVVAIVSFQEFDLLDRKVF